MFSIFASITGEWELAKAGKDNYSTKIISLMELHETMGNLVTWGSIVFFIFWIYLFYNYKNDRRIDIMAFAFLALLVGAVFFTAYLGGTLVWTHGVGTP